jgi:transcriptional regulator with PAS, ATPase and Fis domain
VGRFELADGGTLFLDEIGNVPLTLQAKLLRFIQDHKISRLGGKKNLELNLRLIAATNENLQGLIEKGSFREDLYYRLTALTVHLLPLRNRPKEEKEFLSKFFLERNAKNLKRGDFLLSEEVKRAVFEYSWPGNVREMENALYSACLLCDSNQIDMKHLPVGIQSYFENKNASTKVEVECELSDQTLRQVLERVEREQILSAVKQAGGNKRKAAEILDMDYKNLLEKYKRYAQEEG